MAGKWQFSLRYLLLEILLICVAIGLFRGALELPPGYDALSLVLIIASLASGGAAVGGLYGRMIDGLLWTIVLAIVAALFAPAVMFACARHPPPVAPSVNQASAASLAARERPRENGWMEPNPYRSPDASGYEPPQDEDGDANDGWPNPYQTVGVGCISAGVFWAAFAFLLIAVVPPDPQIPIALMELSCCAVPFGILAAIIAASVSSIRNRRGNRILAIVGLVSSGLLATALLGWLLSFIVSEATAP